MEACSHESLKNWELREDEGQEQYRMQPTGALQEKEIVPSLSFSMSVMGLALLN
jgi:hypothetical protein